MILLIFDVDGTLINSGGAGLRALNRAFKLLYNVEDAMGVVNPHGQTDIAIVEEIFVKKILRKPQDEEVRKVLKYYVTFLKEEVTASQGYRVLDGVKDTLEYLYSSNGFVLSLGTGNVQEGARIKLERGDLNKYFPFGGFGDDDRERWKILRKAYDRCVELHGMAPDAVFIIGDTPLDIKAGKTAGFKTIGVASSIYSMEELTKFEPDFVINRMDELFEVLRKF